MRQQGATLIQMMFALALAAVLTQLGMPAYINMTDDLHRSAAARDLLQGLRSARSHALLQSRAVAIQPLDSDWGTGWRIVLADNEQVLREHRLARPLRVVASTSREVVFSEIGIAQGRNASLQGITLEVCRRVAESTPYRVIVAPSGRVRLTTDEPDRPACQAS
ncbi:type IV pili biogenesis protein FimT [Pseudomonas sp. SWI6]|nr:MULTISPECIES: GspH/FimT family pseudopilin [Pseudomonas]AVD81504.1 type IV pili biogenesis protein FimT [Pseudomonas sp. SWI6]AVD90827.1 type IV pili biogenesis protein FimT [Pseudomonas sp. SWI44]MBC3490647.1 GspH/FimT family pseudopilin [Pseudomonas taiwanensis]MDT8922817.1 GspH/FimT family pseudopilin [Pseudomonas taiwanensis]MPT02109.1 type IV pili biogenesis protein FimT [Pseudomonas sp.]